MASTLCGSDPSPPIVRLKGRIYAFNDNSQDPRDIIWGQRGISLWICRKNEKLYYVLVLSDTAVDNKDMHQNLIYKNF